MTWLRIFLRRPTGSEYIREVRCGLEGITGGRDDCEDMLAASEFGMGCLVCLRGGFMYNVPGWFNKWIAAADSRVPEKGYGAAWLQQANAERNEGGVADQRSQTREN